MTFASALVGAFSMIVKTDCETDGSSAALIRTLSSIYMSRVETSTPATGEAGHLWCLQSTEDIWRWSNGWWTEGQTSTSVTTEAGHLWWWQQARATWTLYCVSSKRLFLILIIIQWLFVNIRCTLHIRVMYRPNVFLHVLWHLLSHKKAMEPVGDRVLFHVLPSVFRPPETFLIFLFVNEIKTYRRNFIDT